jgi:hypothetical protein
MRSWKRLMGPRKKGTSSATAASASPELKILIDAVQAAQLCGPTRKTGELVDKIAALGGSHRAAHQQGQSGKSFNTRKHRKRNCILHRGAIWRMPSSRTGKWPFKYFDVGPRPASGAFRRGRSRICHGARGAGVLTRINYYLITYNEKHEADHEFPRGQDRQREDPRREDFQRTARSLRRKVARYTGEAFKNVQRPARGQSLSALQIS